MVPAEAAVVPMAAAGELVADKASKWKVMTRTENDRRNESRRGTRKAEVSKRVRPKGSRKEESRKRRLKDEEKQREMVAAPSCALVGAGSAASFVDETPVYDSGPL